MNLVRWDPFRELEEVSTRLNRLFNQSLGRRTVEDEGSLLAEWAPAIDVQETDAEYLIKADLPEVKKEEVRVELQDGIICLQGERKQEKEEKGKKFHRIERAYGRFERRLALPSEVDAQKVAAEFKDGVLRVHLPKSASVKPRSVEVKVS
jgi:HSP20 family protein